MPRSEIIFNAGSSLEVLINILVLFKNLTSARYEIFMFRNVELRKVIGMFYLVAITLANGRLSGRQDKQYLLSLSS